MESRILKQFGSAAAAALVAIVLVGCRGSDGRNGANGTNGTTGTDGPPGATFAIDVTTLTPEEWGATTFKATVTSVTAGAATTVNFKITDSKNVPLKGFKEFTSKASTALYASYPNLAFAIAKLVPGADNGPNRWVSYIVTGNPTQAAPTTWVPGRPSTDNTGTLVDKGDGNYSYTFRRDITQTKAQLDAFTYTGNNAKADLDDVTFNSSLTHRVTVFVGGPARGTGTAPERTFNTADGSDSGKVGVYPTFPANAMYDFIPATGQPVGATAERREITSIDACFSCHTKFEFHGAGRQDTSYCVVCHTDQRKYSYANAVPGPSGYTGRQNKIGGKAVGDFVTLIHRTHMGEELAVQGYDYADVKFNKVTYPQDQRNCVKCHSTSTATPQGNNWFEKPSRIACGACHDSIDWSQPHKGALRTDDSACKGCHGPNEIKAYHVPVVKPDPNNGWLVTGGSNNTNASYVAAFANNLPSGANRITWDLSSVTLNSTGNPVFKFKFKKDGADVVFNTYSPTGKTELMDNFVGGPSFYIAMSVPQDGIATPADWNSTVNTYLKNVWMGTATGTAKGNLSATPDASGYYTLTMTGLVLPMTAVHMTGGVGYSYSLSSAPPLVQTNLAAYPYNVEGKKQGGLSVPAPNVWKAVSGTLPAGYLPQVSRRTIVTNQKCNDCHSVLGVFTSKTYHAGQRNDAQTCAFCHNVNRANSGWAVNAKDIIHGIHGGAKRTQKFSWEASAGIYYWHVEYPSPANNCEACHVPGSYNFDLSKNAAEVDNLLWTTAASSTYASPNAKGKTPFVIVTGNEVVTKDDTVLSPYVGVNTAYGNQFSYAAATGVTTQAADTTLVISPYVAACAACHDSTMAIAHMRSNGGSFYAPRGTVKDATTGKFVKQEQCFLCHSAGKIADTQKVHMTFK